MIFSHLTKDLDEKALSDFYGKLYEGTQDEEELQRIAEAEELAELVKRRGEDEEE